MALSLGGSRHCTLESQPRNSHLKTELTHQRKRTFNLILSRVTGGPSLPLWHQATPPPSSQPPEGVPSAPPSSRLLWSTQCHRDRLPWDGSDTAASRVDQGLLLGRTTPRACWGARVTWCSPPRSLRFPLCNGHVRSAWASELVAVGTSRPDPERSGQVWLQQNGASSGPRAHPDPGPANRSPGGPWAHFSPLRAVAERGKVSRTLGLCWGDGGSHVRLHPGVCEGTFLGSLFACHWVRIKMRRGSPEIQHKGPCPVCLRSLRQERRELVRHRRRAGAGWPQVRVAWIPRAGRGGSEPGEGARP